MSQPLCRTSFRWSMSVVFSWYISCRRAPQIRLEGAQRVHISAKYTIMLSRTRLHVYIRASLVIYVRSRRLPTIMTSSIMTACCGVCGKSIGNGVNMFVHFSSTPTSILNLTTSSESQYNDISNDILSVRKYSQLFTHESNTIRHPAQTDTHKSENIISASFTPFAWRI